MKKMSVEFKGTKDGVIIYCLDKLNFSSILAELAERLQQRATFFADAEVSVDVGARQLNEKEKEQLARVIMENSRMKLIGIRTEGERIHNISTSRPHEKQDTAPEDAGENRSLVIKRTLRSGQRIEFPGNVVVLGDINPGAQIVAEGDIFVFGTIRGIAHAGAAGDKNALVVALRLAPTQLRIADIISRAPDEEPLIPDQPEYAYISEGRIMIASTSTKLGS